ncbi:MAG: hypothetical protein P4M13_02450 [Alphaproteobacteria bacterium]|nr:hypothetical protein [Alphaproteobacteria bacterium]
MNAGQLISIALTDATTPTLIVAAAQLAADAGALGKIISAYNLSVSNVLAGNASCIVENTHVTSITVSDTAADIVANLAALQTLVAEGLLASITATDGGTIALTATQATADATALSKLTGTYAITVADTAADIVANLTELQTLAASGALVSITATDGGTIALTATQATADATALSKLTGTYAITVADTAADIVANLAELQTLATGGKLASIALTDGGTPTLTLTAAQETSDAAVLSAITSAYNLSISNVLAANASAVVGQAHVISVAVADTAANVGSNLAALQALAASGKLASITATDDGTIALTATQATADATALSKLTGTYAITVADTAADIVANLAELQTLAASGKLASITATDNGTLSLTTTQVNNDAGAISKLTGTYAVAISANAGDVVNLAGTDETVTGSNVTVVAGQNKVFGLSGNHDTVSTGTNDTAWVTSTGAGDSLTMGNGGWLSLTGDGEFGDGTGVMMSSGSITLQNNTLAWITGSSDTVAMGQNDNIGLSGNHDTLTAGANSIDWVDSTGAGNSITMASGGWVSLQGDGEYGDGTGVTMSNGSIILQNNTLAWIVGSSDTVAMGQNDNIGLSGANDILTAGANSIDWVDSTGVGDSITMANGGWVSLQGDGEYGDGTGVMMSSGTIILQNNTLAWITGSSDIVTSEQNDDFGLSGSCDTLTTGTNDIAWVDSTGAGNSLTMGNGGWLSLQGDGESSDSTSVTISSGTVVLQNNTKAVLSGSSDAITLSDNDNLVLNGVNGGTNSISGAAGITGSGNVITWNGNGGYDTYQIGTNVGAVTVNNAISGGTSADGEMDFLSGLTDENLWFQKNGNNLQIDLLGTSSQITLSGWYGSNVSAQVENFKANGLRLVDSQIAQLVSAMATYAANNNGFNPATATAMPTNTTLQNAIAAAWSH